MRRLLCAALGCLAATTGSSAWGDALVIDFDEVMTNVWTSPIWSAVKKFNVLEDSFSMAPEVCDINGGFDISVTPVKFFPNYILDSDEYALMGAILADPTFDCTATGGTSHTKVHAAWTANFAQTYHDLGGGVGGIERLLPPNSMIEDVEYLVCVMMTIGDQDSVAFPHLIMDLVVNDATVHSIIGDPNLHVPDPEAYILLYPYLGWCGDADGDGCSNLNEYKYFYPIGGRDAYIAAAMDPTSAPPGCSGDRFCDGTGGLLGEYFGTKNLTSLVTTRKDTQVSFNWGNTNPHPLLGPNNFSICWTGTVIPDYSEVYTFHVRTDDGVRLWVNDQLLVDQWNDHGSTTYSGTIATALTAGQAYPIRMEFYENGGDAVAWLGWESASQIRKAIPEMNLLPGNGMGDRGKDWFRNPANGHYYRMTGSAITWTAADALAGSWGGYLTTINDVDENSWIRLTFGPVSDSIYIGANDVQEEGKWVWAENDANFFNGTYDSGAIVAPFYCNWATSEPNNSSNEDAGMLYTGSGQWNDLPVTHERWGLVESNAGHVNINAPAANAISLEEGRRYTVSISVRHPYGEVRYQWRKDGVDIEGATEASYTIDSVGLLHAGAYTCMVSDDSPASEESTGTNLTVIPRGQLPVAGWEAMGLLCLLLLTLGIRRYLRTTAS